VGLNNKEIPLIWNMKDKDLIFQQLKDKTGKLSWHSLLMFWNIYTTQHVTGSPGKGPYYTCYIQWYNKTAFVMQTSSVK
jgi:hypothetical protein